MWEVVANIEDMMSVCSYSLKDFIPLTLWDTESARRCA